MILDKDKNFSIDEFNQNTGLLAAASRGQLILVDTLIKKDADLDVTSRRTRKTALIYSINFEKYDIAKVLIKSGAFLDAFDNDGKNALMYAIEQNRSELVNLLLLYGANINLISSLGETPLIAFG